ncbi:uncharacterized protein K452DRAFT_254254 [Aplosporella prunicola CBS 121167]|uniref:Transcription factor SipA3 n=1 Tax=Aplosporella prunicola CBS 121167 TaxID=1176127 RepID=A0A6A6B6Q2_9PEZI|nr:uncharacterized protein K452DRAFT_254254 [Aplosporella prunicola CBS 121167]KAF2139690.1 hypothetical protein K452DRAFT_254254 [Aplosporella prunicola CBS 121167]
MAEPEQSAIPPALTPVEKPLSLIPVVLKEAALDSPTFRATAVHFGEQLDLIERWLDNYVGAASKLVREVNSLETAVYAFLAQSAPPQQVSEAILDHDYTMEAMKRYNQGAREFWMATLKGMKRVDATIIEPIKTFLSADLRGLKDARRNMAASQKEFDGLIARYAGRKKTEEASSLREEAFQVHEARKAYLRASMDFCVMTPQIRTTLDKLLVKIFTERWREMKSVREGSDQIFGKHSHEMERIRGWSREMENGERVFKRELHLARKQLEDNAEHSIRPSRELEDYSISTVPYLGSHSSTNAQPPPKPPGSEKSEKQGWLFERTITGKPARALWVRRWFFVKNGIFGWLIHGARTGAVEESEKIGLLLCGVRPAFQEERRFCFEVKTKDKSVVLQAETQAELTEWIATFDVAKRKALEDPASTDTSSSNNADAAFAISPPVAPEFAARTTDGHVAHGSDELPNLKHAETLPVPDRDAQASRSSSENTSGRRLTSGERDGESSRDHAARIIQKLDLHRKSPAGNQLAGMPTLTPSSGGIASLIASSHNIHNFLSAAPPAAQPSSASPDTRVPVLTASTLAPSTLANSPAPTNLSKAAIIISGERGVGIGRSDGGMPSGILANLWGSTHWGFVNRMERGEVKHHAAKAISQPPSPVIKSIAGTDIISEVPPAALKGESTEAETMISDEIKKGHRKTLSLNTDPAKLELRPHVPLSPKEYPSYYPLALKAQDAQFRILFPSVPREEKVVLVFRATWNPNDQQEFPGRVYVTTTDVYFYSNHLGLVLITGISLDNIEEITAAPGRDCDFLFIHFKDGVRKYDDSTRVTVKVFLEPLKLLQKRLNFLVRNCNSDDPKGLESVIRILTRLEDDDFTDPEMDNWDNLSNIDTPIEATRPRAGSNLKATLRIDGNLFADSSSMGLRRNPTRFKLPFQPVVYRPQGMARLAIEREFDISAKALFHVMFGDRSAVFQILYRERWAQQITQGPWNQSQEGALYKREFEYHTNQESGHVVSDYQVIEVLNDHLCYVVTDKKTPWYLPCSNNFVLVAKIVITHVAKSRCKLGIYTKVDWERSPMLIKHILEHQALEDLDLESQDLTDVIADQVNKLGSKSKTRKAVQIFGYIGHSTQAAQVVADDMPPPAKERQFKLRRRTVPMMLFDAALLVAADWVSTIIAWISNVVAAVAKVCTAHSMLLALLLFSGGMNLLWSYRDSWSWWQERSAGKFMARLGVKPDIVMGKAVYLRDIDEMFANNTAQVEWGVGTGGIDGEANSCHQTFINLLHNDPDNLPAMGSFSAALTPSTRSTSTRLQRTRQNLGAYRHDLLVAMRLVNRVEREVLQAEWENWLLDENVRCRRVGDLVRRRQDDIAAGKKIAEAEEEEGGNEAFEAVREWWGKYCGDCRGALEGAGRLA